MAELVICEKQELTDIADAIRAKTGSTDGMSLSDMTVSINDSLKGKSSGIYIGTVTPSEDATNIIITHNLGSTDILFAAIWAETLGDVTPTFNGALGKYFAKTDIPVRYSSTGNTENFNVHNIYNTTNANAQGGVPTSTAYWDAVVDENNFKFERAGSSAAKYIAGVTYTVIIITTTAEV